MTVLTELKGAGAEADEVAEEKSGKGRRILLLLLAVALVAAAGWWFLLRGGEPAEPAAGEMLALEATQINLADGHYLKVGVALQLVEGAEEVDGSKALDATIELFTGREVEELARPETRHRLKDRLGDELKERYEGDVMEVYFTEFVTQ